MALCVVLAMPHADRQVRFPRESNQTLEHKNNTTTHGEMKTLAEVVLEAQGINPREIVALGIQRGWITPPSKAAPRVFTIPSTRYGKHRKWSSVAERKAYYDDLRRQKQKAINMGMEIVTQPVAL